MVQHALPMMLQHYVNNKISIEQIVEKMCHAPAICFNIEKRGYIKGGLLCRFSRYKNRHGK